MKDTAACSALKGLRTQKPDKARQARPPQLPMNASQPVQAFQEQTSGEGSSTLVASLLSQRKKDKTR